MYIFVLILRFFDHVHRIRNRVGNVCLYCDSRKCGAPGIEGVACGYRQVVIHFLILRYGEADLRIFRTRCKSAAFKLSYSSDHLVAAACVEILVLQRKLSVLVNLSDCAVADKAGCIIARSNRVVGRQHHIVAHIVIRIFISDLPSERLAALSRLFGIDQLDAGRLLRNALVRVGNGIFVFLILSGCRIFGRRIGQCDLRRGFLEIRNNDYIAKIIRIWILCPVFIGNELAAAYFDLNTLIIVVFFPLIPIFMGEIKLVFLVAAAGVGTGERTRIIADIICVFQPESKRAIAIYIKDCILFQDFATVHGACGNLDLCAGLVENKPTLIAILRSIFTVRNYIHSRLCGGFEGHGQEICIFICLPLLRLLRLAAHCRHIYIIVKCLCGERRRKNLVVLIQQNHLLNPIVFIHGELAVLYGNERLFTLDSRFFISRCGNA